MGFSTFTASSIILATCMLFIFIFMPRSVIIFPSDVLRRPSTSSNFTDSSFFMSFSKDPTAVSVLLMHNSTKYYTKDCATEYVSKLLSVYVVVQLPVAMGAVESQIVFRNIHKALRSVHLSLELRNCKKVLLLCGSHSRELNFRSHFANLTAKHPLFFKVELAEMRNLQGFNAIVDHVLNAAETEYILVFPFDRPLSVSLHMFTFIRSTEQDSTSILDHMKPHMVATDSITNGSTYILCPKRFGNSAVHVEFPTHLTHPPERLRWFAYTREGHGFSDRERNKYLKKLICHSKHNAGNFSMNFPFWICSQVNPLLFRNPEAYMKPDCLSEFVAEQVTVIVTAHVVPSSPSPFLIQLLLQSLHMMPELRHCKKIIVFDGATPSHELRLNQSMERVRRLIQSDDLTFYNSIVFRVPGEPGHLRKTTAAALLQVKTPFVLIVQPDLPFTQSADMYYVVRSMLMTPSITSVRFSRSHVGPSKFDLTVNTRIPKDTFIPMARTSAFSSENHIVPSDLYFSVIFPLLNRSKFTRYAKHCISMECLIGHRVQKSKPFKTFIYGNIGDGPYTAHLDGTERHSLIPKELLEGF